LKFRTQRPQQRDNAKHVAKLIVLSYDENSFDVGGGERHRVI
jgi:hypothetical protein